MAITGNTYLYIIYTPFFYLFKEKINQKIKNLQNNRTLRYEKIHQKYQNCISNGFSTSSNHIIIV